MRNTLLYFQTDEPGFKGEIALNPEHVVAVWKSGTTTTTIAMANGKFYMVSHHLHDVVDMLRIE